MLKSRDITLPTKVQLVKAIVLPVVMYGCESWAIKKAEAEELMLLNCGIGEDSWESPWTARRFIQSILIFIGRTDAEAGTPIFWPPVAKEPTHLKRP